MRKKAVPQTAKDFISIYMKENAVLASIIAIPIAVLFFVVALFADALNHDMVLAVVPLLFGMCCIGIVFLKTRYFKHLILTQEKGLEVSFEGEIFTPFYPKTLFYSSDSWIVKSGCWAFHRSFLQKISVTVVNEKSAARHYVVKFYATDGVVVVDNNLGIGEIKKIKKWHNG